MFTKETAMYEYFGFPVWVRECEGCRAYLKHNTHMLAYWAKTLAEINDDPLDYRDGLVVGKEMLPFLEHFHANKNHVAGKIKYGPYKSKAPKHGRGLRNIRDER